MKLSILALSLIQQKATVGSKDSADKDEVMEGEVVDGATDDMNLETKDDGTKEDMNLDNNNNEDDKSMNTFEKLARKCCHQHHKTNLPPVS
mmetsp:Transcript_45419/g.45981  ORF Transcript_45419/g.45981 Transcript_45419/m.45981 type:complete len:91 (+) Transcript_45419:82-354(+)